MGNNDKGNNLIFDHNSMEVGTDHSNDICEETLKILEATQGCFVCATVLNLLLFTRTIQQYLPSQYLEACSFGGKGVPGLG